MDEAVGAFSPPNEQFGAFARHPYLRADIITNAAEGLPRRRFTVAEVERMVAAGILLEDERFELIGGEFVPMPAKGNQHELLKAALNVYWARRLPDDLMLVPETTFRFSPDTFLEPDFTFYEKASGIRGLAASTAPLVVEISDSSLGFDLGRKAVLYASFGIAELWVIDAVQLRTYVHRQPTATGYAFVRLFASGETVGPSVSASLAVTLADLDLI